MPEVFHNLLRYDDLPFGDQVAAAFVLGYRLEDRPDDLWTDRFTGFKFNPSLESATSAARLISHAAHTLVDALGLGEDRTVFTPALRSAERSADPNGPLAQTAVLCAYAAGCRCYPGLLTKNPNLPTGRGSLDPEFRLMLVEDTNYRSDILDADTVVVVDDFVATGKTLSMAATAIRESNPGATVYGLALAKTEWHSLMLIWHGVDLSNNHIPPEWNDIWLRGAV